MPNMHVKKYPGGYVMISLGGVTLSDESVNVPGVSSKITEALKLGKPIYLCDFFVDYGNWGFSPITPVAMSLISDDELEYIFSIGTNENSAYVISVSAEDDSVTMERTQIGH